MNSTPEIFGTALRLGLTSFGGPVAHIGYFRAEYVDRRRWLTEAEFADLVALCQFLPGPASSQTGFAIGLMRGGLPGGIDTSGGVVMGMKRRGRSFSSARLRGGSSCR